MIIGRCADATALLFSRYPVLLRLLTMVYAQDSPTWNQTQLTRFEAVLDEFQKFGNTAGFFVGNEVLTRGEYFRKNTRVGGVNTFFLTGNGSAAAPYIKAALRDVKAYRDSKNYRKIPIGYSAGKRVQLARIKQAF